jgi:crotonobetainyl-CoA:carnitine CoA-transferase CaiB-like acyl-CoA transferase
MGNALVDQFCADLDLPAGTAGRLTITAGSCLPSRLATSELATGAVGCVALAATDGSVTVDPARVSASFRSDQVQRLDGMSVDGFAPGSGWFSTVDGWIRTHANYPAHRAALLRVLGLPPEADPAAIGAAIASRQALPTEDQVYAAGGVAVALRTAAQWREHPQAQAIAGTPLIEVGHVPGPLRPPGNPLRVLDLTRVIAGPVATRTLAWLGAQVLRIDSPRLPEIEWQHLDTGPGKRTALLDVSTQRAAFADLVAGADVVVTGYRPGALDAYGFGPHELVRHNRGLIVATLSAWGFEGPWRHRRGFDSVVQAATGIAAIQGSPGALPAQALDHATGYLMAAAILVSVRRRAETGGGYLIRGSLARTAQWLLAATGHDLDGPAPDPAPYLATRDTYAGRLTGPRPALELPGQPADFRFPARPFGADEPAWLRTPADTGPATVD